MARSPGRFTKLMKKKNNGYDQMFLSVPTDIARELSERGFTHAVVQYDSITSRLSYLLVAVDDLPVENHARG